MLRFEPGLNRVCRIWISSLKGKRSSPKRLDRQPGLLVLDEVGCDALEDGVELV